MSKKIYCGIGTIPKGSRLGSMKECADMNQIRYYGIKKIDPKLIESITGTKINNKKREQLFREITRNKGKIKRLKEKIATLKDKDKDKKSGLQNNLEKLVIETNKLSKQFQDLERNSQKRMSRTRTMKRSKTRARSKRRNTKNYIY